MKKIIIICIFLACAKVFCQAGESQVFTNGKSKIELTTGGGKCILKKGKINQITIITSKLDTRMMTCSGPGLRFVRAANPEQTDSVWEIDLTNWEENKPYTLFFNYRGKTRFSGKFEIPVE